MERGSSPHPEAARRSGGHVGQGVDAEPGPRGVEGGASPARPAGQGLGLTGLPHPHPRRPGTSPGCLSPVLLTNRP